MRDAVWDCGLLALVSAIGSMLSLPRLGFYTDDWGFFRSFEFSVKRSFLGVYSTFNAESGAAARPIQGLYDLFLYRVFGLHPLGYHLTDTLVIFLALCFFYLAFRYLFESRAVALAVALVYGLMPQYSSVRLWYASDTIALSMLFYFLAIYSDTRYLQSPRGGRWAIAGGLCLILAGLTYEAFLPLFLVNAVLIGLKQIHLRSRGVKFTRSRLAWWLFYLRNPPLIALILWYKFLVSRRAHLPGFSFRNIVPAAMDLTFGAYGVRLPHVLATIWHRYWDTPRFIVALAIVAIVAFYLARFAAAAPPLPFRPVPFFAALLCVGFLLTGLAYVYFWGGFGFGFGVNTGINNRVATGASVFAAFSIVGFAGLLSWAASRSRRAAVLFAVLVGLYCGCACFIDQTIAEFWIAASQRQPVIVREIQQAIPAPPHGASILLHGYCPYIGPGIVFEIDWDTTGALDFAYHDGSILGDVLTPRLKITDTAVVDEPESVAYPYTSLYFYDVGKKQAVRVPDAATALRLQKESAQDPRNACIVDEKLSGFGTPIW